MSKLSKLAIAAFVPLVLTASTVAAPVPEPGELADQVRREPFTLATWPAWRERLRDWSALPPERTDAAFLPAYAFIKAQVDGRGNLPRALERDAVAWMVLGEAYLRDASADASPYARSQDAEKALRQSLKFDRRLARARYDLARAIRQQETSGSEATANPKPGRLREARHNFEEALKLDPRLPALAPREAGELALLAEDYDDADRLLGQAVKDKPDDVELARSFARSVTLARSHAGGRAAALRPLTERFPQDGALATYLGRALGQDGDWPAASAEFARARELGIDPATLVDPGSVRKADEQAKAAEQKAGREQAAKQAAAQAAAARARPGLVTYIVAAMILFFFFYACVMAVMALGGLLLARYTRGLGALELLGKPPDRLLERGQITRTARESRLTRVYGVFLTMALLLFYVALPFVIWGLMLLTLVVVAAGFYLRRGYHSAVFHDNLVRAGGGGVWAVFQALFARMGNSSFGILKDAVDCPRLYQALEEVARRVDTEPITDVYIAPGAEMGVRQEGRGPFGAFGVKRRVLVMGLSTLHFLSVGELKSILAHEYAHFSHADTFWHRFIFQVTLSIGTATRGMLQTGGWLSFLNPFYWFFYLYQKAFALLSSGFSRSREFLADRMACTLYGSDVFALALEKVCTDGALFERTVYRNIRDKLDEGKAYVNMYRAFRKFRDDAKGKAERDQLYKKLLREEESLFDTHPTFAERVKAAAMLPVADKLESAPAIELFESRDAIEEELTDFLTGWMSEIRRQRGRR